MKLISLAARKGWDVPPEAKEEAVALCRAAMSGEAVNVRQLAAVRCLIAADQVDARREATAAADQRTESTLAAQILRQALADPASAAALEALTSTLPVKPDPNITSQSTPIDS